jgi:hypothetical protein
VLALRALNATKAIRENPAAQIILELFRDVFGHGSALYLRMHSSLAFVSPVVYEARVA